MAISGTTKNALEHALADQAAAQELEDLLNSMLHRLDTIEETVKVPTRTKPPSSTPGHPAHEDLKTHGERRAHEDPKDHDEPKLGEKENKGKQHATHGK